MNLRPTMFPPLVNGDRMKQAEFHRRYETYPDHVKFELIGGTVYMAGALRRYHGGYHTHFTTALGLYEAATPGIEVLDNTTIILGEESEPQPGLEVRVLAEHGGQSRETQDGYVEGPPELVAEIAHSTRGLAMNQKREDHERAGVAEYLVLCVEEKALHWFDFRSGKSIKPNREGVSRSRVFPGLWIDGVALLARNLPRVIEVVQRGIASRPHATFVKRLESARRKKSSGK